MLSRLFSNKKSPTSQPLLENCHSVQNTADDDNVARASRSCNSASFWINSEFAYNFIKVAPLSCYALTILIMDATKLESDYDNINASNTALAISIPLSLLFAAGESLCHFAESKLISANGEGQANRNVEDMPRPNLTIWQRCLIAAHYASDIFSDMGGMYGVLNSVANLPAADPAVRYTTHGVLTAVSMWGNYQEVRNASDSLRELNVQRASRPAASAV